MPGWHEDDSFWLAVEPVIFAPERVAQAAADVAAVTKLADLQLAARALDLCCGPGRHAIELARTGRLVTGVDRTREYLDRARQTAQAERVNVEWVQDDMRKFCRPNTFDLVVNLFSSFGYFDADEDNLRVGTNVATSLKPGGRAVFEMVGKEVIARDFDAREWHQTPDGYLLEERTVQHDWEFIETRWVIVREGRTLERTFRIRVFSGGEIKALLRAAGFETIKLYGGLDGRPYDQNAQRLVVVASTPSAR